MRLINKVLIFISIFWLVFLAASFVNVIHYSSINFIILIVLSALILISGIYSLIIKRIEQLNHQLINTLKNSVPTQRIDIKGNDELTNIAGEINQLIDSLSSLKVHVLQDETKKIEKLEQENRRLQQDLSIRFTAEKNALSNRETLTRLAHYDPLTTLPNNVFFNEILNKALNHAKRRKRICAILIIDLNNFKTINETLGHVVGDQVLKEMAIRFAGVLRSEDILAKMDADQYIVLLNDIVQPKFAGTVAEKILKACVQPLTLNNQSIEISASIGICIYPNDAISLEDLMKNADAALAKAKKTDNNSYQFYTQTMDIEAHAFIELETALRKALQNKELVLYYQPKLHIKNGAINGVEALIRWIHPKLGTIDPGQLIVLAEETGLSMQIGEWALREACRTNKYWQDEGYEHISISVNLSPKQFHDPDIARLIESILRETQLNPTYLELEINESTVMDDIETATEILTKIKATGVQLSIDHFGTGYTSISHLKRFPISSIKIDKSFIKGVPHTPNDVAITNAFIALAHNLGVEVIAAGVETAEQVEYLAKQDCDMVQGYFLSHPLPAQKIVGQFTKLRDEVII